MKISQERLEELRQICKKDFNTDLNDQELHDVAFNLLNYYDALMRFAGEDIQKYIDTGGEPSFAGRNMING